jgi:elongation factor P
MLINATQLRVAMLIHYDGDLYRVMSVAHVAPQNRRGIIQTKIRNLRTGLQSERRFGSEEKVDRVTLEQQDMEFLYQSGEEYNFMNTETYEQVALTKETLGEAVSFLVPNLRLQVEFFDDAPVSVLLPKTVDLSVTDTAPSLKGATVTNSLKPATTETGLVVNVPNFIENGSTVRVDTETGDYVSRVK